MRVLVADDEAITRRLLLATLTRFGYQVTGCQDGAEAWAVLQAPHPPGLMILDWCMPGMDGVDICRQARLLPSVQSSYIILLTARGGKEDLIHGLDAGADDYITKPFDADELRARIQVGQRVVQLQQALAERVKELEEALASVKTLQGLLPICSYCKKIRDDHNYWHRVEHYLAHHSDVRFSHGICPECHEKLRQDLPHCA